jgi:hypothetical protein
MILETIRTYHTDYGIAGIDNRWCIVIIHYNIDVIIFLNITLRVTNKQ